MVRYVGLVYEIWYDANAGIINQIVMDVRYNEWDFKPISLNPEQVANPLQVIDEFFSLDGFDGSLKYLDRWRELVLKRISIRDEAAVPISGLYYFYHLNLQLVDAAYLLYNVLKGDLIDNSMQNEFAVTWVKMNQSEREDVRDLLFGFFSDYNLPQYRKLLSEWLSHAFTYKDNAVYIEVKDLVTVYENLQKLYGAMWVLHFYDPENEANKRTDELNEAIEPTDAEQLEGLLYTLNTGRDILKDVAAPIIERIISKLPSTQAIIYLGNPPGKTKCLYLLVLVSEDEAGSPQDLACMIEQSCQFIAPIVALVHFSSVLFKGIEFQLPFFLNASTNTVIYLSGGLILPPVQDFKPENSIDTRFDWQRWFDQGKNLLAGADHYLQNKAYGLALFSLHQCAETLLTAIIRAVLGYRMKAHNLSRLLAITKMFTTDFSDLFKHPSAASRFKMLKEAYITTRYKDTFEPDINAIELLYHDISGLCIRVENIYQKHLLTKSL